MGATSKYVLPWPANSALLKDGAAAIRALAEAVEASLLPPLLVTDGDGTLSWTTKVAEVPWDVTDSPDRRRGTWTSAGASERLVVPGTPGWYLVVASVRFTGKAEPDVYDVSIRTRDVGSTVGTGTVWGTTKIDVPNASADDSQISLSTIVRIPTTSPATGFAVRLSYKGATQPPATAAGNNKLRAFRLSAL
jgi:hypothetical protein